MVYISIAIFILCVFLMGGSIFSFVNVIADRLPENESIVKGRSHCDECRKQLKFIEMIPVFSYILLRGKCRHCGAKLSKRYFVTEFAGGILAIYTVYVYWWNPMQMIMAFVFIAVLACVFLIDMVTMTIPNKVVIAMFIVAVISIFVYNDLSIISRIIGFFDVSLPLLIITMAINGAFGGGDIKLMAATGIFLGWKLNLFALFVAIITGGIYGIVLLIKGGKNKNSHFAFGPFLAVGCVAALFWGESILNWYIGLFL